MLRQQIRDSATAPDPDVVDLLPGVWGTVSRITGDRVSVAIEDFDNGRQEFGPVPFLPSAAEPAVDDPVFLHFDHAGQAALVVVDSTGDEVIDGGSPESSEALVDGGGP